MRSSGRGMCPFRPKRSLNGWRSPRAEPLRRECEHFMECMGNGKRPMTDGAEGLRVLRVLNAAQRSLDGQGMGLAPSETTATKVSQGRQRRKDAEKGRVEKSEGERVRG